MRRKRSHFRPKRGWLKGLANLYRNSRGYRYNRFNPTTSRQVRLRRVK